MIGLTKEALNLMGVAEHNVKDLTSATWLEDLFPLIKDENFQNSIEKKNGIVFSHECKIDVEAIIEAGSNLHVSQTNEQMSSLVWGRLIIENYGGIETGHVFIFSKISKDYSHLYERKSSLLIFSIE